MKLYTIEFKHYGPKSSKAGIEYYVLADSEQDVMDGISATFNTMWTPLLCKEHDDSDEEFTQEEREKYYSDILKYRGEINIPEPIDFDPYYGYTFYGWSEGQEISIENAQALVRLGVAKSWLKTTNLDPLPWTELL